MFWRKATEPKADGHPVRRVGLGTVLLLGFSLLILLVVFSVSVGPLRIPASDVWRVFAFKLGISDSGSLSARDISVVWLLRIPRILMGIMVGASLAVSGAALQSLFNNPLADPGIIGVTSGASVGAVGAIVIFSGFAGQWVVPVGAFVIGVGTTLLVYTLARPDRNSGTSTMLLVGIAVGAGCQALVGFFTFVASEAELQSLVFWQMGSLAKVTWYQVSAVAPLFSVGIVLIMRLTRALDILTLGERQAKHLGLDVAKTRIFVIMTTSLITASAVAFAGSIGFVGLVDRKSVV